MAMKNYMCSKCGVLVQKTSMPGATTCPSGGNHRWSSLGEVGDKSYQCKKCGVLVKSKSMPGATACPSGGYHQWGRL
jgi:DNA-directed RNA polymerase subunit RPC12/RpoP